MTLIPDILALKRAVCFGYFGPEKGRLFLDGVPKNMKDRLLPVEMSVHQYGCRLIWVVILDLSAVCIVSHRYDWNQQPLEGMKQFDGCILSLNLS